ncbi:DUF3570 domain-containing protein [Siansivirga zeaxanthinifaciens]|uniref:DUF3570 domain-containing protein n=1 Tax=Siansivirga zeaxanthinifaciens CC-SAMT-1 TaxID=1454006 RepID=A0A0C5WMS3_9FLAO|nr:DUF3570 domain-containing protein [Siansivirga zeaxanthinifaciens]AJR04170.1 hypothetical protein AW14_11455 [Siansivirga zeaxanthinifaciens CC-SAMT-1]
MKKVIIIACVFFIGKLFAQESTTSYKKRVLETTEVDFLTSYYTQDGNNASVTGGIGTEELTDVTPTIVVSLPLNADDVLTIDAGISAYTSASSSNLNPFDGSSGASQGSGEVEDDKFSNKKSNAAGAYIGTPWAASSGASRSDVWASITADYSHSSDDRNTIVNADVSFATEYDYSSFGFGGGITKLFNEKNTTLSLSTKIYLDTWRPEYPTELDSYYESNENLNSGFFFNVPIYNQSGLAIDKNSSNAWAPTNSPFIQDKARNSYSLSFSFSQILSKNAQFSIFFDLVQQKGWLSNPMQRVYFADVDNYYIGDPTDIPYYTSAINQGVFQLADDIERLPNSRFKIPVGARLNYYLNEMFTLRTYYRYYTDDWGIKSHTAEVELPIKITSKFTLYPSYRYYNQTEADYFAPYETALSTSEFYTSDYDLSKFNANQYGFGVSYTDIFATKHIWKFGLKSIDLKYNNYKRNTGLTANIISAGCKFVMD